MIGVRKPNCKEHDTVVPGKDRRIRVLYVVPSSPCGSSMVFAHEEITRIAAFGFETTTFPCDAGAKPARVLNRVWNLWQRARDYRPDILHAHFGTVTAFVSALISLIARVPLVITYRGSDLNPSPSDGRLRSIAQKLLSQLAALCAHTIVCVSHRLRNRLWWRHARAVVIPSGVDMQRFRPIPRAEARQLLGWRNDEQVILFNAGGAPRVKRLDLAATSVAAMKELVSDIRFVILDGQEAHGTMPIYLNAADCLLITSDYEGSPNMVKEALACGLPIVSVDVGDVAERVEGVSPSRIVPRDVHAIALAAAEILLCGERSNGRDRVSEVSATLVRDRIIEIYDRVASGGKSS